MPGLELEEYGGAGTGGSHWDKRVMLNEFMTGDSSIDDTVYSKMTFGLFEDSGWYKPNYDYTTPLLWGRNAGCDFVE